MYLQGDLQLVFDALYTLGVIEPVLKSDWKKSYDEFPNHADEFSKAMDVLNGCGRNKSRIVESLKKLDSKTLEYIAMEVAREFSDFYSRKTTH